MIRPVSALPDRDGFVHWRGCNRGIPPSVAHGIIALARETTKTYGMIQLKSALRQSHFSISEDELSNIFEQEFGMPKEDALRRARSFVEFVR